MNKITFTVNNGDKMTLAQYDHDGAVEFSLETPTEYGSDYEADFKISAPDFVMLMNSFEHYKRRGEWLSWEVRDGSNM